MDNTIRCSQYYHDGRRAAVCVKRFCCLARSDRVELAATVESHPKADGQTKRFNKALVTCLPRYINEHQKRRDTYVKLFVYNYYKQICCNTNTSPFSFKLRREPWNTSKCENKTSRQIWDNIVSSSKAEGTKNLQATQDPSRKSSTKSKRIVSRTLERKGNKSDKVQGQKLSFYRQIF